MGHLCRACPIVTVERARVLIDLSVAPVGGAGTYAAGFLRGLVDAPVDRPELLTVLVDAAWAPAHRETIAALCDRGIVVDELQLPRPGTWKARLGRGRILARALREHRAELAYFPRDAAPQVRVPYALLAHNLHAWTRYETDAPTRSALSAWLLRRTALRSARRAGAVMAVTSAMAEVMDPSIPVAAVVHHGCALPEGPARAPEAADGAGRRVVMVCTVMANKRIETVVDAVAAAREDEPAWELSVYGGTGEPAYRDAIERRSTQRLEASALRGSVPPDELARVYREADILAVGGTFESFCFPLVEAMRSGCVVVAPACTLTEELCGDAAVTYEEGNSASLAVALERAWDDRFELSRRGIVRARRFDWSSTVARTIAVTRSMGAGAAPVVGSDAP